MQPIALRVVPLIVGEETKVEEFGSEELRKGFKQDEQIRNSVLPVNKGLGMQLRRMNTNEHESPTNKTRSERSPSTSFVVATERKVSRLPLPEMLFSKVNYETPTVAVSTSSALADAAPEVKTQIIELDGFETIGEEWLTHRLGKLLCNWNQRCWRGLHARGPSIAFYLWALCGLLCLLGFYMWYYISTSIIGGLSAMLLDSFLLVLCACYLICTGIQLNRCIGGYPESENFMTVYVWLQCVYCGLSIYKGIALILDRNLLGCLFGAAVIIPTLLHWLNFLLWTSCAPLLLLSLFIECGVRLAKCRLRCPIMRRRTKTYLYKLYHSTSKLVIEALQCPICMAAYSHDTANLCVLLCKTNHVFHENCIFEWLKKQDFCPVCRGPVSFSAT